MGDNEVLSLFNLTLKFVMLLALLNGQRTQTLSFFNLDNMHVYEDRIVFCVRNLVKQSRPSYHLKPVTVLARSYSDKMLCVVSCLKVYILKTEQFRSIDSKETIFDNSKAVSRGIQG